MKQVRIGTAWVLLYVALITGPLLLLVLGAPMPTETPRADRIWWDISMGLGFVGCAMAAGQFLLGARFRRAFLPFGVDLVYAFHRSLALWALAFLVAHWLVLRMAFPEVLGPADPRSASVGMTCGRVALVLLGFLCVSSLARARWRVEYDHWRIGHAVLAVAALVGAAVHVGTVGRDVQGPGPQVAWWGLALSWLGIAAFVRIVRPWRLRRKPYRVEQVERQTHSTWIVTLRPDGHDGLRHLGGQFVWLTLGRSPFAMKEHPFSVASSARRPDGRLELAIKEQGDFTRTIGTVASGTIAFVDGPYGAFVPDRHPSAEGFVFLAGGIGVAPVVGILRTLADARDRRPMVLLHGSGTWEGIIYRQELERLEGRLDLRVVHALTEPAADWTGERGFITTEMLARHLPAEADARRARHYFICGPTPMTRALERSLRALDVPLTRVHTELFEWV